MTPIVGTGHKVWKIYNLLRLHFSGERCWIWRQGEKGRWIVFKWSREDKDQDAGGQKKVGNGHENDRFLPFSRRRGRTTLKRGKLVIGFLEDLALEQVSTPGYFFPVSYLVRLYFYTYQPPLLGRFLWLPLNCINEFYWSKFFLCPFFCLYVLFMSPPVDDLCRFIGAETFYCTPESNVLNWNSDSYGVILCVMIFFFLLKPGKSVVDRSLLFY